MWAEFWLFTTGPEKKKYIVKDINGKKKKKKHAVEGMT